MPTVSHGRGKGLLWSPTTPDSLPTVPDTAPDTRPTLSVAVGGWTA